MKQGIRPTISSIWFIGKTGNHQNLLEKNKRLL